MLITVQSHLAGNTFTSFNQLNIANTTVSRTDDSGRTKSDSSNSESSCDNDKYEADGPNIIVYRDALD